MIDRRYFCGGLLLAAASLGAGSADETGFTSAAQAMAWVSGELPGITAENPKYLTKSDGTVSQWFTDAVHFSRDDAGHVHVEMRERYTQTKAGATTNGRHEAKFSLAEVEILDLTEPGDVTPSGEAARGVLFACLRPRCVAAVWSDQASRADKTDVSIQRDASREKTLAAFRYLKEHSQ